MIDLARPSGTYSGISAPIPGATSGVILDQDDGIAIANVVMATGEQQAWLGWIRLVPREWERAQNGQTFVMHWIVDDGVWRTLLD